MRAKVTCWRGHPWDPTARYCEECHRETARRAYHGLPPAPKTHFYCGHKRTPENTYTPGDARPRCRTCVRTNKARYYRENPERFAENNRRRRSDDDTRADENRRGHERDERLRDEVTTAYGGKCAACGKPGRLGWKTTDALHLDHVNGDGKEHRDSLGSKTYAGTAMYAWARRNDYPDTLQLLCEPCHAAKTATERKEARR